MLGCQKAGRGQAARRAYHYDPIIWLPILKQIEQEG
jgi:hypothetical protein